MVRLRRGVTVRNALTLNSSLCFPLSAPCSPMIKNSSLICGTTSSFLSWMPMAKATGYIVNATSTHGHTVSCTSPTATCTLNDLMCSETYAATVTAQGSQCDSAPGPSTNITTCECLQVEKSMKQPLLFFFFHLIYLLLFTFLLIFQPPVLQVSQLSFIHAATVQPCSAGLTLWEASASWLGQQQTGIRMAATLQVPAAYSTVFLAAWM